MVVEIWIPLTHETLIAAGFGTTAAVSTERIRHYDRPFADLALESLMSRSNILKKHLKLEKKLTSPRERRHHTNRKS